MSLSTYRGAFQAPLAFHPQTFSVSRWFSPNSDFWALFHTQTTCRISCPFKEFSSRVAVSASSTETLPPCCSKLIALPQSRISAPRCCSTRKYVQQDQGLANLCVVSFFGFSLFQACYRQYRGHRFSDAPPPMTLAETGKPESASSSASCQHCGCNYSRVVAGLRELLSLTVLTVKDRQP